MIEYPSIMGSSKSPRQHCIGFEKYDGSNIRVKWTQKNGFTMFGSRTQLFDETHPHLAEVIPVFHEHFVEPLDKVFRKEFPNEREITVFGEFFGSKSFAGLHYPDDPKRFVMFDVMLATKGLNKFIPPKEFVKLFSGVVDTAKVLYEGNFNDELVKDVREGKYTNGEGIVCKGTVKSGAHRGGIWMSKIKTNAYLERLKNRFGSDWVKYGE